MLVIVGLGYLAMVLLVVVFFKGVGVVNERYDKEAGYEGS